MPGEFGGLVVQAEIGGEVDVDEHFRARFVASIAAEQEIDGDVGAELIKCARLVGCFQRPCGLVDTAVCRHRLFAEHVGKRHM